MTENEKIVYYASGRVTVGHIQQFIDGELVRFFVGRLRGKYVGPKDDFKFDTPEEARQCAINFRQKCRDDMERLGL